MCEYCNCQKSVPNHREMPFAACAYLLRYFQELDFPYELDVQLVLQLIPRVIRIVIEECQRVHGRRVKAEPMVSMRTPYKVHLNFPEVMTVEALAHQVNKAVVNR